MKLLKVVIILKDDIYNKLCAVFFAEEVRLQNKVEMIEHYMHKSGFSELRMIELIRARARLDYFKSYMKDVLDYLKHFDR